MSQADDNKVSTNDLDDKPISLGVAGSIHLPPTVGNTVFQVISLMVHLFQMKELFGGHAVENANRHLHNFVRVCLSFKMNKINQESIRLRLFPFSLIREATSCLGELHQGSYILG